MPRKKQELPRQKRFEIKPYYSVITHKSMWRWKYITDSGETFEGISRTSRQAKKAAEKKSGEKI